jgi:tRNA threonylcarbamoyl adenosine modification protein YeaZ
MTDACTPRVALALDSAGLACSVAVSLGEEVVAEEHIDTMHGQAEALLLLVDKAMRVAGQVPAALDLVVATVGPGSFTGIRAGLAAAHGIALATGARLLGVTSFDAVEVRAAASDCSETRFLLVAARRRRGAARHRSSSAAPGHRRPRRFGARRGGGFTSRASPAAARQGAESSPPALSSFPRRHTF